MLPKQRRIILKDMCRGFFMGKLPIQRKLRKHLADQNSNWSREKIYVSGYFYQGLEELGIMGVKPTGFRFKQYQVDDIICGASVLDIGSNCGFVSCWCAKTAKSVTGIELNPYLNRVARDTAEYLKQGNVRIIDGDFAQMDIDEKYDVVLSFSNHHTIDNNLYMEFDAYIRRVLGLLKPGGYLLFESHNVFAEGRGGAGDDGDMDIKMEIMNKYFTIERYRMVKCWLTHMVDDVDKLFIVARQSDAPEPVEFSLADARQKYYYSK